ncbi:MAG: winged helix-turn-helix domain-containing protein [Acidobacteriota bacterium]
MSEETGNTPRIENFGPYRFDLDRSTLYKGSEPVILSRKRLEVLQLLAEHAGSIVRREEIIKRVWPDQSVEENNLAMQIFHLRRDLEDDPRNPVYIVTIPGIGYLLRTERTGEQPPTSFESKSAPELVAQKRTGLLALLRLPYVALSLGGVCLALGLLIGYSIWNSRQPALALVTPYTSLPGIESAPAFSPDGRWLVFSSEGETGHNRDLYLKSQDSNEPIRLTDHPEIDSDGCWSPDGQRIAFLRRSEENSKQRRLIIISNLNGGPGSRIEEEIAAVGGDLDWSPDGQYFAVGEITDVDGSNGLLLLPGAGGASRRLTSPVPGELTRDIKPRFSPNGRQLAFLRLRDGETSLTDLYVIDRPSGTDSTPPRQLTFDGRRITDLQWMPDGRSIIISSDRSGQRQLWQIPLDGGAPRVVSSITDKVESFDLTADGRLLAYAEKLEDTMIAVRPLSTPPGQPLPSPCIINSSSSDDTPRLSQQGDRIAFVSARTGQNEIWIANADCTGQRMLPTFPNKDGVGSPRWSPDGRRITFDRRDKKVINVFIFDLLRLPNGEIRSALAPLEVPTNGFSNLMPSWSADGQRIYFESSRSGASQIWQQELASGIQSQVTGIGGREAVESADGTKIFFTFNNTIWQRNRLSGSEEQVRELEGFQIGRYWCVGKQSIYFVPRSANVIESIQRFDLATRRIEKIGEIGGFPTRSVPGLSVDAEERLLAISYISYRTGDIKLAENWINF